MTAWNKEALKYCTATNPRHYLIEDSGNWADSIRQKRPIIYNDFSNSPNRKGLPEGHVPIDRLLSVPILEDDKVKAVFGVGNKADEYGEEDVLQLSLVASEFSKIIKQRLAEQALRESQKNYASLFANMLNGFAYCQLIFDEKNKPVDFVYLEVNDSFERLTGIRKEAVIGKRVTQAIPGIKEANPELFEIYGRVASQGKQERFEIFFKPLGLWLTVSAYCPRKGYFAAIFDDVSEQKKAESALRETSVIVNSASDAIISTDSSYFIKTWNKSAEKIFGWQAKEVIGKNAIEIFEPILTGSSGITRDQVLEQLKVQGSWNSEIIYHKKDGSTIPVSVSASQLKDYDGNFAGTVAILHDISARRKREEALKNSQRDLARAQAVAKAGSWRLDTKQNALVWSEETYRIFGVPKETSLTYEKFLSFVHPEDRAFVDSKWQRALRGEEAYDIKHRIVANGKVKWVHEIAELEFWDDKSLKGGFGSVQDITDMIEMQLKLEELNRNLEGVVLERTKELEAKSLYVRSLLEASLDPLFTINAKGKITDVNEATEQATGLSRVQLIGSDFSDYFTEPTKAREGYKKAFTEGFITDYPLAIRHKSGKITEVLYNSAVYRNKKGLVEGVFAAARDVTERKKLEKQLQESNRLAAIGATAGMVGHDIRNPLQSIISDLFLVKSELATFPENEQTIAMKESLEEIGKAVEYVNKIVQDLQDFARPIRPVAKETSLQAVFDEVLAKNQIPSNIEIKKSVQPEADMITADAECLKRIVTNLVTNAVQAMPEGGRLSIGSSWDAGGVAVVVEDTGVGIPKDTRHKLFTPLFTTKSKGQGFGLAVVKRMTEALGGTVSFVSEVGKGTKFIIRLPQQKSDKR